MSPPYLVIIVLCVMSCVCAAEPPATSLEEEKYGVKYATDCEGWSTYASRGDYI